MFFISSRLSIFATGDILYIMTVRINDIEIPESQTSFIKEVYEKKYADYLARKEAITREGKELEPMLIALGIIQKKPSQSKITFDGDISPELKKIFQTFEVSVDVFGKSTYSQNWSWLQKCKHLLEVAESPMTSNEIIEVLLKYYEPELQRDKLGNSIPATLSVAWKENKLTRNKRENGEYEYNLV